MRKMPRVSSEGESWEAIKPNIHYFELSTKRGDITLHTLMPKDSVRILMGKPNTVDVDDIGMDVYETWKYKGRNRVIDEFTVEFVNGRLRSVRQYRE